jgi:hypothetical protein
MGVYYTLPSDIWFRIMVFNAIFNNISVILWQSVLLVEETRVPGENHQVTDKLYHIMLY